MAVTPSWRKPVGMLLIMLMVILWSILAVTLIDALGLPILAQAAAYLAAGIVWLWLFPMKRMLRWMELGKWRS